MYYLLVSVAVYKLMRRRLTAVDLRMDRNIAAHYRLAKQIAWSFTDDFAFASDADKFILNYAPHDSNWETLRAQAEGNEKKYWRQGIPYGRFDNAAECLIVRDYEPDGELRIRSFGEYELAWHKAGSSTQNAFHIAQDVFTGFHPRTRPVLWRMLIAQAHIYSAIVRSINRPVTETPVVRTMVPEDQERFRWSKEPDARELAELAAAFGVADAYFRKHLPAELLAPIRNRGVRTARCPGIVKRNRVQLSWHVKISSMGRPNSPACDCAKNFTRAPIIPPAPIFRRVIAESLGGRIYLMNPNGVILGLLMMGGPEWLRGR